MEVSLESQVFTTTNSKGGNKYWKIAVVRDPLYFYLVQTYWSDTKTGTSVLQSTEPRKVLGKNIGKSNETNDFEQALKDMQSIVNKQRDKGYRLEGEEAKVLLLPMLAHEFSKRGKSIKYDVYVQPKLDGCIVGSSLVNTNQGLKTIQDIVDNELNLQVLSFNEDINTFEYKPVTGWFNNGEAEYTEWFDIVPEIGQHIKCTSNHKFYTNNGWKEVKDLNNKEDLIYANKSKEQWINLMCGTILGDSILSIDKRGSGTSYGLTFSHTNEDLFHFKVGLLGLEGKIDKYVTGYGSEALRFVSNALTKSKFPVNLFYYTGSDPKVGSRKLLTYQAVLKDLLTDEALALWIADDGNISYNNGNQKTPRLSISVHRHSDEQLTHFITYFERTWRCTPTATLDKRVDISNGCSGKCLTFTTKDTLFILNSLRDKQIPGVEYKFYFPTEAYVKKLQDDFIFTKFHIRHAKYMPSCTRYDIEVKDNHNYVANDIVIHNCRALYSNATGFYSRLGKSFIPEVVAHLHFPTDGKLYDGELILPHDSYTFQDTITAIKKYRPETSPLLEYHIYDVVEPTMTFTERNRVVNELFDGDLISNKVINVVTNKVLDALDIDVMYGSAMTEGYEGVMVRTADGLYKVDHRSADLLKKKEFVDSEYKIVGVTDSLGEPGRAIFICETEAGIQFNVRPRGTLEYRQVLFQDAVNLIGKYLTVRYQNLTDDSEVPRFPVGIGVRLDYDR